MPTPNRRFDTLGTGTTRFLPRLVAIAFILSTFIGLLGSIPAPAQDAVPAASPQPGGQGSEAAVVPAPAIEASTTADGDVATAEAVAAEARFEPGADIDSAPVRVFRCIELAWSVAQPESLLRHFGEGKVALAFSRGGPRGGIFTRTQASYLLSDLFKYSTTEKFEFVKYRNIGENGQAPFAVADRVFRLDSGILYHDQVYVSLRREGEDWKVAEIKSIDR